MIRDDIITAARTYIGTPFEWHQRLKGCGIDCPGLVICVGREVGVLAPDFDYQNYGNYPRNVIDLMGTYADVIALADLQPGDMAVFKLRVDPTHIAFLSNFGDHQGLIHASLKNGVVEHIFDLPWQSRLIGAFRYKGLN